MRYGSRCSFRLPDKDRYNRCRDDRPSNQPASDHCGRPLFEMPERMRKRMVDKEMINGENGKMLRNDPYEIRLMQNLYDAAVKQLSLKFEILNNEFKVLYARNPIHHIEGRVKAIESMVAKHERRVFRRRLRRRGRASTTLPASEWYAAILTMCTGWRKWWSARRILRSSNGRTIYARQTTMGTGRCIWISVCRCICQIGRSM